jgi:hypothetical protein
MRTDLLQATHMTKKQDLVLLGWGRWSSGKDVATTGLRAAGSSPVLPAVWVFWRLIF